MLSEVTSGGVWTGPTGGASPATGEADGYVDGCQVSRVSASQLQIGIGVCRSDDDTQDIVVSAPLNIDITTTGAGGRNVDTAEQANKWYAVYLIKNVSTGAVAGFLVNEDDIPGYTMPAGYTVQRRVGWWRNNSVSDLQVGEYFGRGKWRQFLYMIDRQYLLALSAGGATVFTDVDLSEWIPPGLKLATLNLYFDPQGTSSAELRPDGSAETQPPWVIWEAVEASGTSFHIYTDDARVIEYSCGNALDDLYIYVTSFYDEI